MVITLAIPGTPKNAMSNPDTMLIGMNKPNWLAMRLIANKITKAKATLNHQIENASITRPFDALLSNKKRRTVIPIK